MSKRTRKLFKKTYNETVNAMTPEIICYGQSGGYHYELSRDHGGTLFGVTVLDRNGVRTNLSDVFESEEDAWEYIHNLNERKDQ